MSEPRVSCHIVQSHFSDVSGLIHHPQQFGQFVPMGGDKFGMESDGGAHIFCVQRKTLGMREHRRRVGDGDGVNRLRFALGDDRLRVLLQIEVKMCVNEFHRALLI